MKSKRWNGLRAMLAAICAAGVLAGAGCELVDHHRRGANFNCRLLKRDPHCP